MGCKINSKIERNSRELYYTHYIGEIKWQNVPTYLMHYRSPSVYNTVVNYFRITRVSPEYQIHDGTDLFFFE